MMFIAYFVNGSEFIGEWRENVPEIGTNIIIKGKIYQVTKEVYFFNGDGPFIGLEET